MRDLLKKKGVLGGSARRWALLEARGAGLQSWKMSRCISFGLLGARGGLKKRDLDERDRRLSKKSHLEIEGSQGPNFMNGQSLSLKRRA